MALSISAASVPDDGADFPDAFEVFHEGIARTLRAAGAATGPAADAPAVVACVAEADGMTVSIAVDPATDLITTMRYGGGASEAERAVMEQLAAFAVGASARELVEHGLTYVLDRLRDPSAPRPVGGILTPRNAGPCFQRPRRLMRALRAACIDAKGPFEGDNAFDRPYSAQWLAMDAPAKHEKLNRLVAKWRERAGLGETSMAVFEIDRYDRVVVIFGDDVDVWDKPPHLLALERWLRQETGERIEVFVEVAKDSNRIRRL
jgi:hypothetical protein